MNKSPEANQPEHLTINTVWGYQELVPWIDQLLDQSHQDHIQEFEHEDTDTFGRFSSRQSLEVWWATPRVGALLLDTFVPGGIPSRLAGMSWFSMRPYPGNRDIDSIVTYGVRLYEGYFGRGLGLSYILQGHEAARDFIGDRDIWLSANSRNERAIHLYEKAGYTQTEEKNELTYMLKANTMKV